MGTRVKLPSGKGLETWSGLNGAGVGWELWAGSHGLTSLAERIRKFPFHTQDVLSPWQ